MPWARLQGKWKQLKEMIRARRRGAAPPLRERRVELVEHIQQLAREETLPGDPVATRQMNDAR
jgi:hypothetical protein